MPCSSIQGDIVVGEIVKVKWHGKPYDATIMAVGMWQLA